MKKSISATVHVDNTCRVQTVNINSNKKFYHLLEKVNEKNRNELDLLQKKIKEENEEIKKIKREILNERSGS